MRTILHGYVTPRGKTIVIQSQSQYTLISSTSQHVLTKMFLWRRRKKVWKESLINNHSFSHSCIYHTKLFSLSDRVSSTHSSHYILYLDSKVPIFLSFSYTIYNIIILTQSHFYFRSHYYIREYLFILKTKKPREGFALTGCRHFSRLLSPSS